MNVKSYPPEITMGLSNWPQAGHGYKKVWRPLYFLLLSFTICWGSWELSVWNFANIQNQAFKSCLCNSNLPRVLTLSWRIREICSLQQEPILLQKSVPHSVSICAYCPSHFHRFYSSPLSFVSSFFHCPFVIKKTGPWRVKISPSPETFRITLLVCCQTRITAVRTKII